jgi:hypothetical protein
MLTAAGVTITVAGDVVTGCPFNVAVTVLLPAVLPVNTAL